jgi:hypothetical protein
MKPLYTLTAALGLLLVAAAPAPAGKPDPKPGEVFGYGAAFDAALQKIGQITPEEFARRFAAKADYLDRLGWDPTTAKFFDQLRPHPANPTRPGATAYDFRPDARELALFRRNGFVVSERMGGASFGEVLYRVYSHDLPVYLSSDALLQAWHRSFDAALEDLEETYLSVSLDEILSGMAAAVPDARKEYGRGVLSDGLSDADYFLAVGRSLLAGKSVPSLLGQDRRVADTLAACDALRLQDFALFGRDRHMDFSQFKPRGHYENSDLLKRYFRAMMWCGRVDLRVAGNPEESSPRELAGAVVLHDLLRRAGKREQWRQFDRVLRTFVGRADSLTFDGLDAVLAAAKVRSPADVKDLADLERVQARIVELGAGVQQIHGDVYYSPLGPEKGVLPHSFTVMGQRFVLDSWALSKVVYDDVYWDGKKVQRRIPSGLDAAFAVLGNDQAVPLLTARMTDAGGLRFRDGLPYQHNLAAVRTVVDAQDRPAWDENLYSLWLSCLRELSAPTTDAKYPEAMRTRAWALRTLNTQLASWAQLRHDTVLYAKQSYTWTTACDYPAGYVEPRPAFWARFEHMAARAADLIDRTPFPARAVEKPLHGTLKLKVELPAVKMRQVEFFRNFARHLGVLRGIAEKERAGRPLSAEETAFLRRTVEKKFGGSGGPKYSGWYFGLFYKGPDDADKWDALVADVHTDVPDPVALDPGCVLHEGVGNVDLMLVAVDSGPDRMVYAGPVLSHYEFEVPGIARRADSEWRKEITQGRLPPRPGWIRDYFVPGVNPDAKNYQP